MTFWTVLDTVFAVVLAIFRIGFIIVVSVALMIFSTEPVIVVAVVVAIFRTGFIIVVCVALMILSTEPDILVADVLTAV